MLKVFYKNVKTLGKLIKYKNFFSFIILEGVFKCNNYKKQKIIINKCKVIYVVIYICKYWWYGIVFDYM